VLIFASRAWRVFAHSDGNDNDHDDGGKYDDHDDESTTTTPTRRDKMRRGAI
jgi:hypothetical protein